MQHFTRLRFAAGTAVGTVVLSALVAGCGGATPVASFTGNPAFQQQTQPNSSAAKQVAQQNLRSDLTALLKDAKVLATEDTIPYDLSVLASDFSTEQQDWQSEQSDSCSSVPTDENLIAWDASMVSRDVGSLQTDITGLQTGNIATVTNDLSNVQNDLKTMKLLGVTPQVTITAQVAAGDKAVNGTNNAVDAADVTATSTSAKARTIVASAQQWAKQHSC
jgi:hypothetical protein